MRKILPLVSAVALVSCGESDKEVEEFNQEMTDRFKTKVEDLNREDELKIAKLKLALASMDVDEEEEDEKTPPKKIWEIGQGVTTSKYAIAVQDTLTTARLKGGFFDATASEGGVFVCVLWYYKNISKEPISSFETPDVHLISPDGVRYNPDVEASLAFASINKVDEKILSDVNPGIMIRAGDAFEVNGEFFTKGEWQIMIDANVDIYYKAKK